MPDMFTVASKEFSDIVRGKRFLILVVVFGLVMTAAVATTYLTGIQAAGVPGRAGMARGFLGAAGINLATMVGYFAPIMGLALGFDAISGEREKGTLKVTLAQPVFRDTVINGKFLAALLAISLATGIASIVDIGGSVLVLGITPTVEDVARFMLFLLFSILFAMTYYGIAVFLSTVLKRTTQSVIIGVVLWAVFTFVIPIVSSLVAFAFMPIRGVFTPGQNRTQSREEMERLTEELRKRTAITETINSVTPNHHFTRIAQSVLQAYAGMGMNPGAGQSVVRTVSITESLFSAWPNILVLTLTTVLAFIASYIVFTRQEIR